MVKDHFCKTCSKPDMTYITLLSREQRKIHARLKEFYRNKSWLSHIQRMQAY